MLSERDLPLRLIEERAFIDYLGPQDEPWVRVLLAEMARFEGRRRRELAERLAEPLPCEAPHFKRRAASRALLALWRREPDRRSASAATQGRAVIPAPRGPASGAVRHGGRDGGSRNDHRRCRGDKARPHA